MADLTVDAPRKRKLYFFANFCFLHFYENSISERENERESESERVVRDRDRTKRERERESLCLCKSLQCCVSGGVFNSECY